GVEWEHDDLVNKWYLNQGELPAPDHGCGGDGKTWDANHDGVFNVQDYTTVTGGAVPAWASVCDTRLAAKGDSNGNGIVDPEDLIATFSDGKDDDGNGYVDDISGWDFFHNDNDPRDDTRYGHGTGESSDSSNQGNNMRGGIGTCPDCSVMLLRVGDSFMTETTAYGLAVTYATDNGVSVVQEATGGIDNSPFSRAAMDYAYANNVAIVASAADENSFHHNFPGANNHTFYVHAITFDSDSWQNANTFLNYNNCSNYGAQLAASVSGASCSSEATGKASGVAGLVYAAALQANLAAPGAVGGGAVVGDPNGVRRVTAEEVYAVLKMTEDDLYDPADATDPTRYPTKVGWDQRFGYGRLNARHAVDAVLDGKIPPEVEIRAPRWFQVLYPERTPKVPIDGRIAVTHAAPSESYDWVVEFAPGIEPDDATGWTTIASGASVPVSSPMSGTLAQWDIGSLTVDNPTQGPPDNLTNRRAVTLRVRVTLHSPDASREGVKGEFRKAVFVEHDPDLLPGFPIDLGGSGEMSAKIVDLLGDGKREIVLSDAGGRVHAFRADGSELPGFPAKVNVHPGLDPATGQAQAPAFVKGGLSADVRSSTAFSIAVGDIDGDKKPEVVAASYDGWVYAFHNDGSTVAGWPFVIDRSTAQMTDSEHILYEGILAAPVLADFDGDGTLEIVVATMNSFVYVLGGDGKPFAKFHGGQPVTVWDTTLPLTGDPHRKRDRIVSTPAVGDLNGDGVPDIVTGSNEDYDDVGRLYAIDGRSGDYLPGWPLDVTSHYVLPMVGSGMPNAPAIADLDGNGVPEILVGGIGGGLKVYEPDGKNFHNGVFGGTFPNSHERYGAKSNGTDATTFTPITSPSVGDLDDDGVLDVVEGTDTVDGLLGIGGGTRHDAQHFLSAWDTKTGAFKVGFPQVIEDWQFFSTPAIADIDGDGHSETIEGSGGYWVHAFRADGTEPAGWPKLTGGWLI
ncbi:MAG TPA: FG-GAP-like repeat-containing protein, partial [Polyangiaceae bacterium]|nr:FG-GAP-like repeat-containing protein [Polyangiaceae bacterium]